ncbi:MAG: hypothetical protein OHK005_00330 [Candidatus Methylacidiphilales bacterium]
MRLTNNEIGQPDRRPAESKKVALPLLASIFIHATLLVLIGGAVLVPGVIPRSPFVGEMVVPSNLDVPEEAPVDEFLFEDPVAVETPTLEVPEMSSPSSGPVEQTYDVIASSVATSGSTFNLPVGFGLQGIDGPAMGTAWNSATAPQTFASPTGKRSTVQFFGIRDETQRVAFLLDVSGSMVTEQRGGEAGYDRLKQELIRMVWGLDPTSEFNVYLFGTDVDAFKPKAVPATDANKDEFAKWITPYMKDRFGNIRSNSYSKRLMGFTGLTRLDVALTGAMETGSDTIFVLTDGTPMVKRPPTDKELADWQELRKRNAKAFVEWEAQRDEYYKKYANIIAEMRVEIDRQNKALSGRTQEWIYWIDGFKGLPPRPEHNAPPGYFKPDPEFTRNEILEYLDSLYEELYRPKEMKKPTIHIVGYSVAREDKDFLQQVSRRFGGRYQDFRPSR